MVNHLVCSNKLLMNSDLVVKQDHRHAPYVQTDLPHCVWIWRGWGLPLKGLLFGFWVITVYPGFLGCVCDAVFPSWKENFKQRHCCIKWAFRKSLRIIAEGYGCKIPYAGSEDSGTTEYICRSLILAIPVPSNKFRNFHIPWCEWVSQSVSQSHTGSLWGICLRWKSSSVLCM
jgi:hypothetical protein